MQDKRWGADKLDCAVMKSRGRSGFADAELDYNHQQARWGCTGTRWMAAVEEGSTMSSTESVLGSIVSLWRYPVKSMMGEELNASEVTKGGLLGDRAYALVDASDGKVATAKNPRKWLPTTDAGVYTSTLYGGAIACPLRDSITW
jgi:hypothetical protein